MVSKPKIAIIGGGIAGLAGAYFLKKHGLDSVVYERKTKVGGRCSTLEIEGVYVNRGALMFSKRLNPCFTSLIHELGIAYREVEKSKFILQVGNKLIPLSKQGLLDSGLFNSEELHSWVKLQQLLQSLRFDYTEPDERLLKWHGMSLHEFCKKEVYLSDRMIDYLVQIYASFQFVDTDELAADKGLFSISNSTTPLFTPKNGMGEITSELEKRLADKIRCNTHVGKVQYDQEKGFMVRLTKGKDHEPSKLEGPYDCCIFATGQRSVKTIMPEVDFEVQASKTRGFIIEAVCPQYRSYEVLIFPKAGNKHGVHGGELQHLPDGRSICAVILYRGDADLGAVFKKYKIIERFGWSPAITVMPPDGKIVDVSTNVKNVFMVGDFYRYPNLEACIYTAKKVAGIIAEDKAY